MEGPTPNVPAPIVGDWYRRQGGELFEIVAIDEEDGTIEVQHFDGTVEELDFEAWADQWEESLIETAEAPEDWTGSVDVEPEDGDERDELSSERQWLSPLDYFDESH